MKKWLLILLLIPLLLVASIYIFIPSNLNISEAVIVPSTPSATSRVLWEENKWRKWWPVTESTIGFLNYNGYQYTITDKVYRGVNMLIHFDREALQSKLYVLPMSGDSAAVKWQCVLPSGINPYSRFQQYRRALAIKDNMSAILHGLGSFLEKPENIYNRPIETTLVRDTLLVATRTTLKGYPTISAIYSLIGELRKHIASSGAMQTGFPMMNIQPSDSTHSDIMIAIPINRQLPDNNKFFTRKLVRGYILKTRVTGGEQAVERAFKDLEDYISDYQKTKMAIPFQSLVTERINEPDSSKWVTDLYYPIMR